MASIVAVSIRASVVGRGGSGFLNVGETLLVCFLRFEDFFERERFSDEQTNSGSSRMIGPFLELRVDIADAVRR